MSMLKVDNVTKRFAGLVAVNNVSFEIKKGDILGLIGANGAGKTTLFNVIAGVYSPDSGTIKYKGEKISGLKPYDVCKKGIARTFQIAKPFLNITVLENVVVGAFSNKKGLKKARNASLEVIEFVGLASKKDLLADSLTLADRKRLEVAKALATEPTLLLLDEVVAGLNAVEVEEMIALIGKVHNEGITLFIVEHVMKSIMSLSDRIIVLHHGKKIAEGAPKEIAEDSNVIDAYLGEKYIF